MPGVPLPQALVEHSPASVGLRASAGHATTMDPENIDFGGQTTRKAYGNQNYVRLATLKAASIQATSSTSTRALRLPD